MYKDIPYLSYSLLTGRAANHKPYRNKLIDAWPLGDRKLSNRHFRYNEATGAFDLYSGPLDALDTAIKLNYQDEAAKRLLRYAHVARVHPDNTMELVAPYMWSNFMFLSEVMSRSTFARVWAKGGAILTTSPRAGQTYEHPLFKGFRVNLDTKEVHHSAHYKTYHPTLKRKESKEYIAQFDEFKRAYNVFLTPLSGEGIKEIVTDLAQEFPEMCSEFLSPDGPPTCYSLAELLETLIRQRRYTDAAVMCAAYTSPWSLSAHSNYLLTEAGAERVKKSSRIMIDTHFNRVLMRHKFELFNYEEIPMGGKLKSSKWFIRTIVDGKDGQDVVRL